MIFIDYRLDWIVKSDYRLDWQPMTIAKIWIDWIGLDWQPCFKYSLNEVIRNLRYL